MAFSDLLHFFLSIGQSYDFIFRKLVGMFEGLRQLRLASGWQPCIVLVFSFSTIIRVETFSQY
jgi:hypothetical protein